MFERFTDGARAVVVDAQQQARDMGDREIRAEHLLLALSTVAAGVALGAERDTLVQAVRSADPELPDGEALRTLGVDLDKVRRRAEAVFGVGALDSPVRHRRRLLGRHGDETGGHLPFTRPAKRALADSLKAAVQLGDTFIGPDHVLLGLLADDRASVPQLLRRLGVEPADLRAAITARQRAA